MNIISLNGILPEVFRGVDRGQSDLWQQELQFSKGERILIEALSGSGKTSLASFLFGQRRDYVGKICFDQRDIKGFDEAAWNAVRKEQVAMLFQDLRLFPELSAMDNVLIKNRLTNCKSEEQIEQMFSRLGIADKTCAPVSRLSYGQQQRVALIRALCQPFDFLIADEPVSHLDDRNGEKMAELILEEVRANGAGVIVMSIGKHFDLDYTRKLAL